MSAINKPVHDIKLFYMYMFCAKYSRMALRKVRIPTWLRNSRMVSDHSRIAQGIFSVLSIS